ncbi:MAG: PCRF domain-containing protein, partial [Oscillospiraceae bacterium]
MQDKLQALENKYIDIEAHLNAPETYGNQELVTRLNKEQAELAPIVAAYRASVRRRQDLQEAQEMMSDPEMKEMAQEEYAAA